MNNPEISPIKKTGRRAFLTRVWRILGLVALAEFSWLTLNMLKRGKKEVNEFSGSHIKEAGNVEDFPVGSVTADRVNRYFLVREEDGGFLALTITCSHLGCSVIWNEEKKEFICPCHSSAFDSFGNVINSPAPRALDYFPVIIESGKVKIDMSRKTQRKKFDKSQLTYAI